MSTKFMRVSKRKTLKSDDINNSIQLLNFKRITGNDAQVNLEYERIENYKGLWKHKQNIVDIEDFISKPISSCPMNIFPHFHWMVIEGKRPNITENFIKDVNHKEYFDKKKSSFNLNRGDVNNFQIGNINQGNSLTINQIQGGIGNNQLILHNISKELQIFMDNFEMRFRKEIKQGKVDENENGLFEISKELVISLNAIKYEPGVVELLPYIISFLISLLKNKQNINDEKIQWLISLVLESILSSPFYNLTPYLHQIVSLLISLLFFNLEERFSERIIQLKDKLIAITVLLINKLSTYYEDFIDQLIFLSFQKIKIKRNEQIPRLASLYTSIGLFVRMGVGYIEKYLLPNLENILLELYEYIEYDVRNNSIGLDMDVDRKEHLNQINFSQSFDISNFVNIELYNESAFDIIEDNNEYKSIAGKLDNENKLEVKKNKKKEREKMENQIRWASQIYNLLIEASKLYIKENHIKITASNESFSEISSSYSNNLLIIKQVFKNDIKDFINDISKQFDFTS